MLDAPYAVLTTLGRDSYPQSTMVAFLAEDGPVRISLNTTRQKTRNLMAQPRATLLIPDPANPYRTLEIRGDVEITPDDDYSFARRVGQKYGGTDFRSADRPGESRVGSSCAQSGSTSPTSGRRRASSRRPPRSWFATV